MSNMSDESKENSCCESEEDYVPQPKDFVTKENEPSSSNAGSDVIEITPLVVYNEERMRKKLMFFFMNPVEKWQAKRRFPYKFVVQVIKIILVTMQLCLFAHTRYNHVNYTWDNRIAFSHLFLKGWDMSMEVDSYPPATGPLAIYEKSEFFEYINYALDGYINLNRSIGPYSYPSKDNELVPPKLCLYSYKIGEIFGFNESYVFNPEIVRNCFSLHPNVSKTGVSSFLQSRDETVNFSSLVKAKMIFSVKTVNFKPPGPLSAPDCYKFDIIILFDNGDHDGQMLVSLDAAALRLECNGNVEYITDTELDAALRSILNVLVIFICLISFVLCTRAIYRAQLLRIQTVEFFKVTYNKELDFNAKLEFLNLWYVMILCNDVMLIIGSALKEKIERKLFEADRWNICSVFLGVGNLLVWFGVLRYLGFFKTYNVVILTLKKAAPKILRFLICALLIYAGFTFCGWLVLGPYHMKFRSLSTTSECLFSLINGDDMFATFTTMSTKSPMLLWFCRIYLYTFVSLYIYVVLSLFISVIMDAYDTIKRYYREGFPQSDIRRFVGPIKPELLVTDSTFDVTDNEDSLADIFTKFCCCGRQPPQNSGPTGYTSLNAKGNTS